MTRGRRLDSGVWRSLSYLLDERVGKSEPEYLAQWNVSLLSRDEIRDGKNGKKFAIIDGQTCNIQLSLSTGSREAWVYWENSWHTQSFYLEFAGPRLEEFNKSKILSPVAVHKTQRLLRNGKFCPRANADYTCSFLEILRSQFSLKQDSSKPWCNRNRPPLWTMALGMVTRQPLIFNQAFCKKELTVNVERDRQKNAIALYLVGIAVSEPCENCVLGQGPFSRCVVDPRRVTFGGMCSNCAFQEARVSPCSFRRAASPSSCDARHVDTIPNDLQMSVISTRTRSQSSDSEEISEDEMKVLTQISVRSGISPAASGGGLSEEPSSGPSIAQPAPARLSPQVILGTRPDLTALKIARPELCKKRSAIDRCQPGEDDKNDKPSEVALREQLIAGARSSLGRVDALRRCFYQSAYADWISERARKGKPQPYGCIEEFLAEGYVKDLKKDERRLRKLEARRK